MGKRVQKETQSVEIMKKRTKLAIALLLVTIIFAMIVSAQRAGYVGSFAVPERTFAPSGEGDDWEIFINIQPNLHAPTDIGTHSDWTEMQDEDATYNTLTEADTGGGGIDEYKYVDGLSTAETIWTTTGASPYLDVQDDSNTIDTSGNGAISSWYTFGQTTGTGSGFTVVFSIYHDSTSDSYIEWELDWTGDGTAEASGVFTTALGLVWENDAVDLSALDTQTEIDACRARFTSNKGGGGPDNVLIDSARLYIVQAGGSNYDLDLEVGWNNADFDETSGEELVIWASTQGSEALRVDVWSGSWINVFTDIAVGENTVDVSAYLVDATFEIRFTDTSDEAVEADTYLIDCVFLHVWTDVPSNNVPVNDQVPTLDDADDTDNMYAQYQEYEMTMYVSDLDGFADIDYLEISLWDNGQTTEYFRFRYDEDTNVFTEEYDSGTVVVLNAGGSSAVENVNDIDATFLFTVDWDFADLTDVDMECYVIDDEPESDSDFYEANFDVETRLDYSVAPAVTSDDAGTIDRGDLDEAFNLGGTLIYYTSVDNVPATDQIDVWVAGSEYGTTVGPWSDLTLTAGAFDVTCYADDVVGQDTYTVKPVLESAGSGGASQYYTTDLTDTYIADRIQVQSYSYDNARVDINSAASDHVTIYYDYDNSYLATGTVTINGVSSTYDALGVWDFGDTKATVQLVAYNTVAVSGETHGLGGAIDQNGQSLDQIWDQIVVVSYTFISGDGRIGTDVTVTIDVELHYDYDNTDVVDGTVTVNGQSTTYQSLGKWRFTDSKATVQLVTYNTVQATGNAHGITVEDNTVTQDVIWDNVRVVSYTIVTPSGDSRVDTDVTVTIDVELHYDYDETDVVDGTITVNALSTTYQSLGKWRFTDSEATVMMNTYNTVVATGNAYGIETEDNTVTQDVIWDRIRVVSYTIVTPSGDSRVDTDVTVTIDVELHYDYDETDLVDGTVTVNSLSTIYQSAGKWRFTDSEATVIMNTYDTVVCTGNAEGITVEDNTVTQNVIWDQIRVISYTIVTPTGDSRVSTSVTVTIDVELHYDYDETDLIDGTVTVNGFSATYQSAGKWRFSDSETTVLMNTYNAVACTGNAEGITVEDNTVTQDVIWDNVQVQSYAISGGDDRINTDATVTIDIVLWYDYDNTAVIDGTVTVNGLSATHQGTGTWRFTDSESTVIENTYNTVAASGNAEGISTVDQNGQSESCIWDRLVIDIQADDETPQNDVQVTFTVTIIFDFDDTTVSTYTVWIKRGATDQWTQITVSPFYDTNTDVAYGYLAFSVTSEPTYGITVFTTNTETVTWSAASNEVPVNDTDPTISNADDTDNLYAKYRFYLVTSYVSDADGYTDINYVELSIWDNGQSVEYIRLRYTVIGSVFTVELGSAYIVLSGSGVTETGNDIDVEWSFEVDWDFPDLTDLDLEQYVYDGTDSDTDWYEANWEIETRLTYSVAPNLSDDRGNTGTADLVGAGTVTYYTSALFPTAGETDVWIMHDVSGTWSGDVTSGAFSITSVGSSASVRENTYTFKVVEQGAGSGGSDLYYTTSLTDTFITDTIQVQSYTVTDVRVNLNDNVNIDILLWYDYDNTAVTTGTLTINGASLSHQGSGTWRFTDSESTVLQNTYDTVAGSEPAFGITVVDQNSQSESVIWDQIVVVSYTIVTPSGDSRVDTDVTVTIDVELHYDYDNTDVVDGTVTVNSLSTIYQSLGKWRFTDSESTVMMNSYDTMVATGNAHGITVEDNTITQDVIWDRVRVVSYTFIAGDARVDTSVTVTMDIELHYDYDETDVVDGTVTVNGFTATYQSLGKWRFSDSEATVLMNTYDVMVITGNAEGITVEDNTVTQEVIWDQIKVIGYTLVSGDARIGTGVTTTIDIELHYDYDESDVTDGSVTVNGFGGAYQSAGKWRFTDSEATVMLNTYDTAVCTGNTHGITIENQNGQSVDVVWDNVQVQSYAISGGDDRIDTDATVTIDIVLWYDYDNTAVVDGTVMVNGKTASHQGAGTWRFTDSESLVVENTYDTVVASGNEHGINTVDQNSQSESCIWDRMVIVLGADDTTVENGIQVNFTITVTWDFDDEPCTVYTAGISIDTVHWYSFTHTNKSLFVKTDSENSVIFTADGISETTYAITAFTVNSIGVTWSAESTGNWLPWYWVNTTRINTNIEGTGTTTAYVLIAVGAITAIGGILYYNNYGVSKGRKTMKRLGLTKGKSSMKKTERWFSDAGRAIDRKINQFLLRSKRRR